MTQVMQRLSLHYSGNFGVLRYFITQVAGLLETIEGDKKMRAFGAIDINFENKVVILEVSSFTTRYCKSFKCVFKICNCFFLTVDS